MASSGAPQDTALTPLHRLVFKLQHQLNELLLEQCGVGFAQVRILGELENSVPRSQKEISSRLGQSEANVSRQLRLMRSQQLVSIIKSPKDARQKQVTLTSKGKKVTSQALKILGNQHDLLLNSLSRTDAKIFVSAVGKLLTATSNKQV